MTPALKNNTNSSRTIKWATAHGPLEVTTAVVPASVTVARHIVWWTRRGNGADPPAVTVRRNVPTVAVRRCPTCPQPPKQRTVARSLVSRVRCRHWPRPWLHNSRSASTSVQRRTFRSGPLVFVPSSAVSYPLV